MDQRPLLEVDLMVTNCKSQLRPAPYPKKLRLHHPRTKSGCLSCRKRKKKCDETRPCCVACIDRGIECRWPCIPLPDEDRNAPAADDMASRLPIAGSKYTNTNLLVTSCDKYKAKSWPENPACKVTETPSSVECGIVGDIHSPRATNLGVNMLVWHYSPNILVGPDRPARLTLSSPIMLQHYMEETGVLLGTTPAQYNPFVTTIIPIAYDDDLIMHTILALSGVHLMFKQKNNFEMRRSTFQHYSFVLKGLQASLHDLKLHDTRKKVHILLALLILAVFEAISGNNNRSLFMHLRASREIIHQLRQVPKLDKDVEWILGLSMESYAYLVLSNTIAPYGMLEDRTFPFDNLVTSLSILERYNSFGITLCGAHGLFEIIPQISLLFSQRLAEGGKCSSSSRAKHQELSSQIFGWQFHPLQHLNVDSNSQRAIVGEVYRNALVVYLEAAMSGAVVDNPKVIEKIQHHIEIGFSNMLKLINTPIASILLWPAIILASCIVNREEQNHFLRMMRESRFQMQCTHQVCDWLEVLWKVPDPTAYGPYGLCLIIQRYNYSFCLI